MTINVEDLCQCGHSRVDRHWDFDGHCFAMDCAINEALWLDLFIKSSPGRKDEAANSKCQAFTPVEVTP